MCPGFATRCVASRLRTMRTTARTSLIFFSCAASALWYHGKLRTEMWNMHHCRNIENFHVIPNSYFFSMPLCLESWGWCRIKAGRTPPARWLWGPVLLSHVVGFGHCCWIMLDWYYRQVTSKCGMFAMCKANSCQPDTSWLISDNRWLYSGWLQRVAGAFLSLPQKSQSCGKQQTSREQCKTSSKFAVGLQERIRKPRTPESLGRSAAGCLRHGESLVWWHPFRLGHFFCVFFVGKRLLSLLLHGCASLWKLIVPW